MITQSEAPRVDRSKALAKRDRWNEAHPIGTFVRVWQSLPAGDWFVARTKSQAFVHGHGAAVHVAMCVAPIYLSNLEPISADALAQLTHDTLLDDVNRELANPAKPYQHQHRQAVAAMSQLPPGDR